MKKAKKQRFASFARKSLFFQSSPFLGEGGSRGMGIINDGIKKTMAGYVKFYPL
jgi:hypothetical protein